MAAYLTVSEADELAETLANLSAWNDEEDDDVLAAALELASLRFDMARRYQGRKYSPTQELEFPRIAYDTGHAPAGVELQLVGNPPVIPSTIWDWDSEEETAVVPSKVKSAVLYEANSILEGSRDRIAQAIHNGLSAQAIGSASESYVRNPNSPQGTPALCQQADLTSLYYQIRSGRAQ